MTRTTGARLAQIFVGYALIATLCAGGIYFGVRPTIQLQMQRTIDGEARGFRALYERVDPRTFGGIIATRVAVDAERGVHYSLRAPDGALVVGNVPDYAWTAPAKGGVIQFRLPNAADPSVPGHRAIARIVALGDGSRLLISYDVDARVRASQNFVFAMIAGIVATALLGALASWMLARDTNARLDAVSQAIARILAGDLSQRLPVRGNTGVDRLAREFNVTLDRIERLTTTMRAVADSTAHDLRAPLNRLRAAVEVALRREDDPAELRRALDTVLVEVDRVQNTLEALLRIALAESGTAPIAPVDLSAVVADVEELYAPLAEENGLSFAARIDTGLELPGNRQLLAQAVANLVDNAIKFTPRGGSVRLAAIGTPDAIVLEVADTGPGIAVADRERALERSRRLANASGTPGSGLGLSLVNAVARLHGGRFELADNGPGVVARLRFAREPAPGAAPTGDFDAAPGESTAHA
jgi:signal transduction histidine kinase